MALLIRSHLHSPELTLPEWDMGKGGGLTQIIGQKLDFTFTFRLTKACLKMSASC